MTIQQVIMCRAIYDHIESPFINTILVNNEDIPLAMFKRDTAKEDAEPVHFDVNSLYSLGLDAIFGEIVCIESGVIRHDTNEVAKILYSLLIDETFKHA